MKKAKPKQRVLVLDIETSFMRGRFWQPGEQYIRHDQIEYDWHLMSWAAKWLGEKEVFYMDQRGKRDISNDKQIAKGIWKLIDTADVLVYQNGDAFDRKKLNTRFLVHDLPPPSSYKTEDTLKLSRKIFGHTSNKLDYVSENFNKTYKKLKHKKFPGEDLWLACEAGDLEAWDEMKKYNIYDVLATEEYYLKIKDWAPKNRIWKGECSCGSTKTKKWGFRYTEQKCFQRLKCSKCGTEYRGEEV